jgi:hypothetical protein
LDSSDFGAGLYNERDTPIAAFRALKVDNPAPKPKLAMHASMPANQFTSWL